MCSSDLQVYVDPKSYNLQRTLTSRIRLLSSAAHAIPRDFLARLLARCTAPAGDSWCGGGVSHTACSSEKQLGQNLGCPKFPCSANPSAFTSLQVGRLLLHSTSSFLATIHIFACKSNSLPLPSHTTVIMSGPGVGFEYPRQPVTWLKRDLLLFANSIGCTADELHYLYVCLRQFAAFLL